MKLSVYLGEDEIRAVLGRCGKHLEIVDCIRLPLKKGALINDLVVDEETVREALRTIAERFAPYKGHVHLMLGGNEIITKVLPVPNMTSRQMKEMAKHELKPLLPDSDTCNYRYDYSVLYSGEKGKTMLCAAVRNTFIDGYKELFRSCGMTLESVDVAIDAFHSLAKRLPAFRRQSYLLMVADGRSLAVYSFSDGIYTYASRLRLIEERGTTACLEEMKYQVLSMIYFNRMQREEIPFDKRSLLKSYGDGDKICFCGLTMEEEEALILAAGAVGEIEVLLPDEDSVVCRKEAKEFEIRKFLYAASGLSSKNCMNLMSSREYRYIGSKWNFLFGVAAVVLALGLLTGLLAGNASRRIGVHEMEKEIEQIKQDLAVRNDSYEHAQELEQEVKRYRNYLDGCEAVNSRREETPVMTSSIYRTVTDLAMGEAEVVSMELINGKLSVQGRAADDRKLTEFVKRLEASEIFRQVNYDGFTYAASASDEEARTCSFNLICVLKAGGA